jgi:serine/threonine-protein kinase HipA
MILFVCLEGQVVGRLEARGSRVALEYLEPWLSMPGAYPISQSLPLRPGPFAGAAVLNYLWGLLPDNPRTLDAWGRLFQVSPRNAVSLLAHVGEDCAGAVQFVREERLDAVLDSSRRAPALQWLDEAELARRIRHLAADAGAVRESPAEGQFSLSGAQAKTAFFYDSSRDRYGIPQGRTPTTHIFKPVANDFDGFAENEHFCLELARRVGLPSARTHWRLIGEIPTLIAERYDRVVVEGRWVRIHQEDCCQALGIHPASKYENEGGPGFRHIMALLESADDPTADRARLMRTACFVYLIAATDAHAKNYSLLLTRGADRPSMRLAPLYDMASAWPYARRIPVQKMKLAMRVGNYYRLRQIQLRHFDDLARSCRYPAEELRGSLMELSQVLPDEAAALSASLRGLTAARETLGVLVDAIDRQCRAVLGRLAATPEREAGAR